MNLGSFKNVIYKMDLQIIYLIYMYKEGLASDNLQWLISHRTKPNQILFFFIIQCVKARAIPCPHQPPSRGDNTVSVAQGGTDTPGATKQLLPPDRVLRESYIYIYIYIRQIN